MANRIKQFSTIPELNLDLAALFAQAAKQAIAEKGHFTVALTGGSSPVGLYELLAKTPYREQVAWEHVYVFWGDERWVPLTDSRSNAKMSFETLLNHVPVPDEQVFPMWSDELDAIEFAVAYERLLKRYLGDEGVFDLILLGMGADGHTASWFPGTAVLDERAKWVDAYYLPSQEMYRVTLTVSLVNHAKQIAVVAYGANKAEALHQVLEGATNPQVYPAQLIDARDVTWFVDQAAASKLTH
ncbi:6-phosphogluconolactonase [Parapedobacter lycopersici]|uniref:6-phosphogluconolactonase n=1 Tax=Parapedobacter lycopersici TaxID=1864939 RepID=UPI00334131C7